jgi:hypothetical protein
MTTTATRKAQRKIKTTALNALEDAKPEREALRPTNLARGTAMGVVRIFTIAGAATALAWAVAFVASRKAQTDNYPAPEPKGSDRTPEEGDGGGRGEGDE